MRPLTLSLAAATLALISLTARASESDRFRAWLDVKWEETLKRSPITATAIGDARYNDLLPDTTTAAWRKDSRRLVQQTLQELKGFRLDALAPPDRVSYRILKYDLENDLRSERFPDWQQPLNQFGGLPAFLVQMGSGQSIQPFKTTKDYEDWIKRLSAAPAIFDGMIGNIRLGLARGVSQPRVVMERVLPQLAAQLTDTPEKSLFWGPFAKFPEAVPEADRERLQREMRALLASQVLPAYRRLHDFVRDVAIPQARTRTAWTALPDGAAWYAHRVAENTTTFLRPEAIHQMGLKEVARIKGEMDLVRQQVGFQGDLKAFFQHLQDDPRYYYTKPEDLLNGYRDLQKKINGLLPKLFDIAPKADYEVREVEAFRAESAAGASYESPSADGSRPGVFYVNTFNLKAQPIFGMETLSLHEASPGHHFQIAIAQEDPQLPAFRRFGGGYVAYAEGWALYAESLGKELGLFTDPYQWYGRLSDEQLRAMRLVVDTGLHAKGWSREKAIQYMLDNSSMAPSDVQAEVERYLVIPGQALGYKIGQFEIRKLRTEAEKQLGARFDIKGFHKVVLTAGSVPLAVLREVVQDWIRAERAPLR